MYSMYCLSVVKNLAREMSPLQHVWHAHVQGFIRPVARVGSGDPVRVLRLYTMITLDEVCSIYC